MRFEGVWILNAGSFLFLYMYLFAGCECSGYHLSNCSVFVWIFFWAYLFSHTVLSANLLQKPDAEPIEMLQLEILVCFSLFFASLLFYAMISFILMNGIYEWNEIFVLEMITYRTQVTSFILQLDSAPNAVVISASNENEISQRTDVNFKWKQRLHLMTFIDMVQITNDKWWESTQTITKFIFFFNNGTNLWQNSKTKKKKIMDFFPLSLQNRMNTFFVLWLCTDRTGLI